MKGKFRERKWQSPQKKVRGETLQWQLLSEEKVK